TLPEISPLPSRRTANSLTSRRNDEVVVHFAHSLCVPRQLPRACLLRLRIDETAQLNNALEGRDVDLVRLRNRITRQRGFDLRGNGLVIGILTGAFASACDRAAGGENQRKRIETYHQR